MQTNNCAALYKEARDKCDLVKYKINLTK